MNSRNGAPRFPGLLLALAAAVGAPAAAALESAPSPWEGTGIDLSFLDQEITNASCRRAEDAFLACIGAVQQVLDVHGRDLHLRPDVGSARRGAETRVAKRFGAALVVEDRSLRVAAEGNALEAIRARTHRILGWRDWLTDGTPQAVDFDGMRRWLRAEIVDPARRGAFAAAAVNGYLGVRDAHGRISPAGDVSAGGGGQRGSSPGDANRGLVYTGIGAGIQPIVDAAMVTSVLTGGPAHEAGLRTQDFILAVDGEPVAGLSAEAIVERLRGESGTEVLLTVKRQDRVLDVPVRRGTVKVRNVLSYGLIDRGWQFAYVKIDSFLRPDTCRDVRRELDDRLKPTLNGLILDLRDNSGGLIDQAVCVADLLLAEDETVLEIRSVDRPDDTETVRARRAPRLQAPMVTIVNATTGSASEVLAGALQDHGRSLIVGDLTFGKGTVQTVRSWRDQPSILELYTAARYYRPSGVGVQLVGIEPDVPAPEHPDQGPADRVVLRERDLFPTALPRERKVWRHPNPQLAAAIADCAATSGLARHRLRRDLDQGKLFDYPLAVGQDALVCTLNHRP